MRRILPLVEQLKTRIRLLATQLCDLASDHVSVSAFWLASRDARDDVSRIYRKLLIFQRYYKCKAVDQCEAAERELLELEYELGKVR